jgi:DNA-binding XRE family transcriptional regulator
MPAKKSAEIQAVGEAMRSLRRERGIAQEAFAARAGLDRSFYGAIERGEFNITLAIRSSRSRLASACARAPYSAGRGSEPASAGAVVLRFSRPFDIVLPNSD